MLKKLTFSILTFWKDLQILRRRSRKYKIIGNMTNFHVLGEIKMNDSDLLYRQITMLLPDISHCNHENPLMNDINTCMWYFNVVSGNHTKRLSVHNNKETWQLWLSNKLLLVCMLYHRVGGDTFKLENKVISKVYVRSQRFIKGVMKYLHQVREILQNACTSPHPPLITPLVCTYHWCRSDKLWPDQITRMSMIFPKL